MYIAAHFVIMLLMFASVFSFFYHLYDPAQDAILARLQVYGEWLREQFDRMFMDIPVKHCMLGIAGSTVLFGLMPIFLLHGKDYESWLWNILRIILLLACGKFGWGVPRRVVAFMWDQRVTRFDDQMLDALTLMSNALKAGLSFIQSMDTVVKEMPSPINQEFGLVMSQLQLGVNINETLVQLDKRMGSEDVRIVVTAIMILRETGGNLSDTFDTIAFTIRERKKVKGKIAALTTQGIMQGIIIFCMPFVLGLILYGMNPEGMELMWTTVIGVLLLILMILLQVIGGFIMKKMVTIRV